MTYLNEEALVNTFVACLNGGVSPWGTLNVVKEFFYQRGRVDLVGVAEDEEVIAFEAKLMRWRHALQQAYRNKCFAHRSYVLLPHKVAEHAFRYRIEFERRRVGLCTILENRLLVLCDSLKVEPLQPWLSCQVLIKASEAGAYAAHPI